MLWAYHTIAQSSTNETCYRLVFGAKVIIPIEVSKPNLRRQKFDEEADLAIREVELDLVEED